MSNIYLYFAFFRYKYEMIEGADEEESESISTKNELLDEMYKDFIAGKEVPKHYKKELENYIKTSKK
jgi:hypothetical protein